MNSILPEGGEKKIVTTNFSWIMKKQEDLGTWTFESLILGVNINCSNLYNYFLTVEIRKVYHYIPPTTSFSLI